MYMNGMPPEDGQKVYGVTMLEFGWMRVSALVALGRLCRRMAFRLDLRLLLLPPRGE
jgi:hypothetical protein